MSLSLTATSSAAPNAPSNTEKEGIVHPAHGFMYKKELHPKHFINPANELAVRELHRASWEAGVTGFEYHIEVDNKCLAFHGWFIDRAEYKVCCTTPEEVLRSYPRGKALVSLLHNQRFAGVEAFAVACQNALGEDVDSVLFELCPNKFCRSPGEFYNVVTSHKSRNMAD
jgi:hypothetical protein